MAYATVDELAEALRVTVTVKNSALLQYSVDAAAEEIDHDVGRPVESPIPVDDPLAHMVNLARGIEWFKCNDSAFGAIGFDSTGVLAAPKDGFGRHSQALTPLKMTYGVA